MVHKDLVESGLSTMLEIKPVVNSENPLAKYLGEFVRYKPTACIKTHGNIITTHDFRIGEIQKDYKGDYCLRGYAVNRKTGICTDNFGRAISQDLVEII